MIYSIFGMMTSFVGIIIDNVIVQRIGQTIGISVLYVMVAMKLSGMV